MKDLLKNKKVWASVACVLVAAVSTVVVVKKLRAEQLELEDGCE